MQSHHYSFNGCRKYILLVLMTLSVPFTSYARDITFQWTANPEPLSGYKLYYKTGESTALPFDGSGINEGNSPIYVDKVITYTVTGLSPDLTYQFTLTAYNTIEESGFSTIVTVPPDSSPTPTIIDITVQ